MVKFGFSKISVIQRVSSSLVFFVSFALTCSCSEPVVYSDAYAFGQDSPVGLNATFDSGIAEADTGYYFCSGPNRSFLFFYDKEKRKSIPVCNKPDCLHQDEPDPYKIANCNAYIGSCEYLSYYKGNIYYVTDYVTDVFSLDETSEAPLNLIYKISPDGAKKQVLEFNRFIDDMKVHRGYIYFSTSDMSTVPEEDINKVKNDFKLYRYELDKYGAKPEILFSDEQISGDIGVIVCFGNDIYYSICYMREQDNVRMNIINRFNSTTKVTSTILEEASNDFTIFNGNIIYCHDRATYACDLDGKNPKKISDAKGMLFANSKYLLIDNYLYSLTRGEEHVLTIIDTDWNIVKEVPINSSVDVAYGCSEEFFFVPGRIEYTDIGQSFSLYCIPLDKGPEDMTLQLLHEFVSKVPFRGVNFKK